MTGHEHPGAETIDRFTDDELAEMALALDVNAPVGSDAVPISQVLGPDVRSPLPNWYMPAPMGARKLSGWQGRIVRCGALSVIASFVAITAAGLCNTYGQLHF
jgi:hypothetical protein